VVVKSVTFRFRAHPDELFHCRQLLREWLRGRLEGPERDDVVLACSEACSNAIAHAYPAAAGEVRVELARDADETVVVVCDDGAWSGEPVEGLGLRLMRAVMDSVELERTPAGTRVTMRRARGHGGHPHPA
jgi:anti-sigma regulatory factor (Ser/Thr protein kinase)